MDNTLANIADYSNAISIAVIIACFLGMAIFILRLNLHGKVNTHPGDIIPGRMMKGVHNPYSLSLASDKNSTLKEGVSLEVRCQTPCIIQAFWGVSISQVYPGIYLHWEDFLHQILDDSWLEEHVTFRDSPVRYEPSDNMGFRLKVPDGVDLDMGHVPRTKYPLVVVLLHADCDTEPLSGLCVTSLVTIFHLRDEDCPGKSHIISQYIRTPIGAPCMLQQLYVASTDEDSGGGDVTTGSNQHSTNEGSCPTDSEINQDTSHGECIICQSRTINRALLPCRHACVCDGCFLRLDKCPMCRSVIESYFQLTPSEESPWVDEEEENDYPKPWWEDWNDRINAYLGFR